MKINSESNFAIYQRNKIMTFLKIRNSTFYITLIWLFVYSAVIPMQLSNFVLCIGVDGHVELEYSINGCCTHTPSHDDHAESDEDHCGDCIDLPIFASLNSELYIVSDNKIPKFNNTQSLSTQTPYQSSVYFIPSTTSIFDNPPLKNPTLLSIRTVVLLT